MLRWSHVGSSSGRVFAEMPVSLLQQTKRALVVLLVALARTYKVALKVNRDSPDSEVRTGCRKLLRKVHPDKGGSKEDTQKLTEKRDEWEKVLKAKAKPEREQKKTQAKKKKPAAAKAPSEGALLPTCWEAVVLATDQGADSADVPKEYRLQGTAVLLTYQNFKDEQQWRRFNTFVRSSRRAWKVRHWCTTLEACPSTGRLHCHLMMQFRCAQDCSSKKFTFESLKANVRANDLCGEGICRKRFQQSVDRGFFYVWADKIGTVHRPDGTPCVDGSYHPVWTLKVPSYKVLGKWAEELWKQYKVTHAKYEEYLFLSRDGVVGRKRNLDAVVEHQTEQAEKKEMAARLTRLRANPRLFPGFPVVPAAAAWLEMFKVDALRYPVLVVRGKSFTGKTEWVKSLFRNCLELKVGNLTHFPEGMRAFSRSKHDGLVLDDVRDMQFLVDHQDKLQGKYDAQVEFASTPGGRLSFKRDLYAVPIAVTVNFSTKNLQFLTDNDWLGNPANRVLVEWPVPELAPAEQQLAV